VFILKDQSASLTIDGIKITIPVPAEGVNVVNVSAVVSGGVVADFADPSGILAGKVVNLSLGASDGQDRISYSAISAIETAFKSKGAVEVSSDTAGGAIPVFDMTSYNDGVVYDDLALLAQRATATTPEVKIVNDIKALYNGGNQVLQVQSPMQLTGDIWCSQLDRIQTTQGTIYADETLGLSEYGREITLEKFLAAYAKCGFDLNAGSNNNFLPSPGVHEHYVNDHYDYWYHYSLNINDTVKSWDIYRLFERYHDKGKLANLTELCLYYSTMGYVGDNWQTITTGVTVAGESPVGLFGADNQPSATFPYKVKGEVLGAMTTALGFENLYEYTGNLSLPANTGFIDRPYKIRNFATGSQCSQNHFEASGACFFEYATTRISHPENSTLALKLMNAPTMTDLSATYIDLSDLPISDVANVQGGAKEVAFASAAAFKAKATGESMSLTFPRDINYAKDNSGTTKLIGTTPEGFGALYASKRDTGIYGVLDLQGWTDDVPPADKTAAQFHNRWTAAEFNSLLL
jgi:hypothetical protein